MVNITIDNQKISVPEGTTIMEAAASIGIQIPKLCYLKALTISQPVVSALLNVKGWIVL